MTKQRINAHAGRILQAFLEAHPRPLYANGLCRALELNNGFVTPWLHRLHDLGLIETAEAPAQEDGLRRGSVDRIYYRITPVGVTLMSQDLIRTLTYTGGPRTLRLTRPVADLLRTCWKALPEQLTTAELSERTGLGKRQVTGTVHRLSRVGVVERVQPSEGIFDNPRQTLIALTGTGQRLAAQCSTPGLPLTVFPLYRHFENLAYGPGDPAVGPSV